MVTSAAKRCAFHEQRPGFAVCMQCRNTLCQECATQWDGIWYCAACLGAQRKAPEKRSAAAGWIAVVVTALLILFLSTRIMIWSGVLLAGLR